MGCSPSKTLDVCNSQVGSIPGSPNRKSLKKSKGNDARKVCQNVDFQSNLCPASWPELNVLLCKLKQETPMFNASCGATTIKEIIDTKELMKGLEDGIDDHGGNVNNPPTNLKPRRSGRSMSVSVIHTVEDVDAVIGKNSNKIVLQDDFTVNCREVREPTENDAAIACMESSERPSKHRSPSFTVNDDGDDQLEDTGDPVFDPELLQSFEKAVEEVSENERLLLGSLTADQNPLRAEGNDSNSDNPASDVTVAPENAEKLQSEEDLLGKFEWRCPPNGDNKAVLYTTSLRGIRKTYEDCQSVKSIVESYGVSVDERDVSMHSGFLRELKRLTEQKAMVPRLFIKGKYVGGAQVVMDLHEEGKLGGLLRGLPLGRKSCEGCGGLRFFPCVKCNGSCKVMEGRGFQLSRCSDCNENGLVQCPLCSSSSPSPR